MSRLPKPLHSSTALGMAKTAREDTRLYSYRATLGFVAGMRAAGSPSF